jgi:hypothetical protein
MRMQQLILLTLAMTTQGEPKDRPETTEQLRPLAEARQTIDMVQLSLNFYEQSDGGGNPNLKEEVAILQPMLLLATKLSEEWNASLMLQGDAILGRSGSGASGSAAAGTAPAGGGGEEDERDGERDGNLEISEVQYTGVFTLGHQVTPFATLSGGLSLGNEDDYRSFGLHTRWTQETRDRNNAFLLRLSMYFDRLDVVTFDGTDLGEDQRRTISPGVGYTRVLNERTLVSFGYDLTLQSGFLSTAKNSVVVASVEVPEALPERRLRHSLTARARLLLSEPLAVEPEAGAYADDWGARGVAAALYLHWEASRGALILRPGVRWYAQTEVDDFLDPGSTSIPAHRTQDSDLGSFTTRTLSLKATFLKSWLFGDELDLMADVADRSDGIRWFSVTIGFTWGGRPQPTKG